MRSARASSRGAGLRIDSIDELDENASSLEGCMQFSLRSILFSTLLVALLVLLYARIHQTEQIAAECQRQLAMNRVTQVAVERSIPRREACQQILQSTKVPSPLLLAAQARFHELQSQFGQITEAEQDMPRTKMVPVISDDIVDRRHVRLFIPAGSDDQFQLRLAVFPCRFFRDPKLPELTDAQYNQVLDQSPFEPTAPTYIPLSPGKYDIVTTWIGDDQRTFTLAIDGEDRAVIHYTLPISSDQKYGALGSWVEDGWLRPEQDALLIRAVSPIDENRAHFSDYSLRCELIRVRDN
jgi:hypothetical protein